jgi:hypothetical protein
MNICDYVRDNAGMADVSIAVAVVSGAVGIVGASAPQIIMGIREGRRAERDRRDRIEQTRHRACVSLLRAVLDLRVLVTNSYDYHGNDMGGQLADIRDAAADVEVEAVVLGQTVRKDFPALAEAANEVAAAAGRVADAAEKNANLELGASTEPPDFGDLNVCIGAFKDALAGADRTG